MTQPEAFLPGAQRSLASRTSEAIGRNPDRRTGTVISFDDGELVVQVAGGAIAQAGYLASYLPIVGDVVALILQRSTWLALGKIADQTPTAPPVVFTTNGVHVAPGTEFSNSTAWKSIGGTSFAFTKQAPTTRLFVTMSGSGYCDAIADAIEFGVQLGATDYSIAFHFFNIAGCHFTTSGSDFLVGVPAAVYGVQPRFRRAAGGGTVRMDFNDRISVSVTEVI